MFAAALPAQTPLLITHVNVVDVVHGPIQRDMALVIVDGKITEIRQGRLTGKLPSGAMPVDGLGKFCDSGSVGHAPAFRENQGFANSTV